MRSSPCLKAESAEVRCDKEGKTGWAKKFYTTHYRGLVHVYRINRQVAYNLLLTSIYNILHKPRLD